ncbi:glycosyltransferase [Glutamicibacter arilaitensis]|uniref:glycosyltransferase n=1 Tax=Glutamicibacter arilaitensis TaxID=256701 RepID=UPI003FD1834E
MERAEKKNDISVVIGFKDWGVERLLLSVKSILKSFGNLKGEVIVSDYGSEHPGLLQAQIEDLGAIYVYTSTNGTWSRSRALNAGFAVSTGSVLISTDADMLFTPNAIETISNVVLGTARTAVVLQCRDLPQKYDAEGINKFGMDWESFESVSTLRPRWGMGGMMAVRREDFLGIRGFDERMEIYGGEDMDFAYRIQRLGSRIHWIEDRNVRMFHMWHASSRNAAAETAEGKTAIETNREITMNDKSFIRNTRHWEHKPADALPLASIVISTYNRANYLSDSLNSVLAQNASEDIEIIVVDDGSTDNTEEVVSSLNDSRIRYFKREKSGIAAARNFAATVSRSRYTVIHDDDDMMPIDRVESHFKALDGGTAGTYGGWIDFSDETGEIVTVNPGKDASLGALLFSGKVLAHATLMLPTSVIKSVGYDELLRSGSDYNLAIRLARAGIRLKHTGNIHLIRRLHSQQVTTQDSVIQKASARLTTTLAIDSIPLSNQATIRQNVAKLRPVELTVRDDLATYVRRYLPDHLVDRCIRIGKILSAELFLQLSREKPSSCISIKRIDNKLEDYSLYVLGASLEQIRILEANSVDFELVDSPFVPGRSLLEQVMDSEIDHYLTNSEAELCIVRRFEYAVDDELGAESDVLMQVKTGEEQINLVIKVILDSDELFDQISSQNLNALTRAELYVSKSSKFKF